MKNLQSDQFSIYKQVSVVSSFNELVNGHFRGAINAICWHRVLNADFSEIVAKLSLKENITDISVEDLLALSLSTEGDKARTIILTDLKLLAEYGAQPTLNLIKSYNQDQELDFISTDVYSYHVDRSPVAADTFLCTYFGVASDIIPNDQVEKKVLIPEIRRKLKELHDGEEIDFEEFLEENFFDLHYEPKANAAPVNLGIGHLWKLAIDHPEQNVLPCVHRAPREKEGKYRLLLIC
jgi:hypothetical protein